MCVDVCLSVCGGDVLTVCYVLCLGVRAYVQVLWMLQIAVLFIIDSCSR